MQHRLFFWEVEGGGWSQVQNYNMLSNHINIALRRDGHFSCFSFMTYRGEKNPSKLLQPLWRWYFFQPVFVMYLMVGQKQVSSFLKQADSTQNLPFLNPVKTWNARKL